MKKKTLNLKKLSLNKLAIANLNGEQQAQALGGATLQGDTSPCGPCNYSVEPTCLCISDKGNTVCLITPDCPATGPSYCRIC